MLCVDSIRRYTANRSANMGAVRKPILAGAHAPQGGATPKEEVMREKTLFSFYGIFLCVISVVLIAPVESVHGATFITANTNDSGAGSLRQAILDANVSSGLDVIAFNIPGTGPHTIQPNSALPFISDPVVIDGYTQPGAFQNTNAIDQPINAVLQIEIDGSLAGSAQGGFDLRDLASGSTIRGLVINRFGRSGIISFDTENVVIEGNFIGTDVTGMEPPGSAYQSKKGHSEPGGFGAN